jgi:hypothetical protein
VFKIKFELFYLNPINAVIHRGADKSLALPGTNQATSIIFIVAPAF